MCQGHSELILEELVGGRLYTGPMYIKYNTILRSKTNDVAVIKNAKELCKGNNYVTTIHAINSCVIKLSKLTKAGKVWRGIKDAALPKEFWIPNDMGVVRLPDDRTRRRPLLVCWSAGLPVG
jgi:hypothetical protein